MNEVRPQWNEIRAGLAVGEDDVLVDGVNSRERGEEMTEVDFRAADPSRDQVQGINSDAQEASYRAPPRAA
jgi:hypothetical protein